MSFILDALNKSERRRRALAGEEPQAICEPPAPIAAVSRRWILVAVALLFLCILLLLAILVVQSSRNSDVVLVQPLAPVADTVVMPAPLPSPAPSIAPQPDVQRQAGVEESEGAGLEQRTEPTAAVPSSPSAKTEDPVYRISDLPPEVRRRLPVLQMALHAYNPAAADASLVQINGRLVRAGAQLAENLTVEEITPNGAILRSGSYLFLLPRRGQ
ncbi:MAG: general secretion pathway protein GspB [Desulfuromonadales bacterium]|nr:general secretion pathway protein GspB [Desulfuromonadales bacterium]